MSTPLSTLPHRRRSRRRARNLRARILVSGVVLLLSAYVAWQPLPPSLKPGGTQPMTAAGLLDPVRPMVEPDQSIDTEGALSAPPEVIDATRYVVER